MRRRVAGFGWLLVGASLAGASAPVAAQTASGEQPKPASKVPAGDDASVSMEFLEFLGEWETDNGEWVDPARVQTADWPVNSNDSVDSIDKGTGNAK